MSLEYRGNSESGAVFSPDGKYRYRLWRSWDEDRPRVCFILLNPSTADEIKNDPTIERQVRRVKRWHTQWDSPAVGSVEIVNACALRSTDPEALNVSDDPVGPDNGEIIQQAAASAVKSGGIVVCGWGKRLGSLTGFPPGQSCGKYTLHDLLMESLEDTELHALKLNADGTPAHPLYLPYALPPRRWFGRNAGMTRHECPTCGAPCGCNLGDSPYGVGCVHDCEAVFLPDELIRGHL